MNEHNLQAWVLLHHQDTLTPRQCLRLLEFFGVPEMVLQADVPALVRAGLSAEQAKAFTLALRDRSLSQAVDEALRWEAAAADHAILPLVDPCYPPLLKEIHDPPLLLFVQGSLDVLLMPQIALVGSRRCSVDGLRNTRYFSGALASHGLCVSSGLARGIDATAHETALDAEACTVAVMGTGIDQCYPPQNRRLAQRIRERGALITELPLGSQPKSIHFPRRNRIISGMSLGVVVIEAALRSGSLITARLAMEQGREVFAVPGSIHNPLNAGGHRLIQQGASLLQDPEEVLSALDSLFRLQVNRVKELSGEEADPGVAPHGDAEALLDAMGFDPVTVEVLLERTALSLSQVQSLLCNLELAGHISRNSGHYIRC